MLLNRVQTLNQKKKKNPQLQLEELKILTSAS